MPISNGVEIVIVPFQDVLSLSTHFTFAAILSIHWGLAKNSGELELEHYQLILATNKEPFFPFKDTRWSP